MRARTLKRAAQERQYAKLRGPFLAEHPTCEWCQRRATEVHHRRGRRGLLLLAVEHWAALCHDCHAYVTVHPEWAYSVGLSERRVSA